MSESGARALQVSFDGASWLAMDTQGNFMPLATTDAFDLPELPAGSVVHKLLLPVERLLSRTFSLPLSSSRYVDQEILAQQLQEQTAEQSEDWWLAWQAGQMDDGVAGMMFGLSETVREQFLAHDAWQQVQTIGVDVWARLNAQLHAILDEKDTETVPGDGVIAVFDMDIAGVFFGVWHGDQGSHGDGCWRGMRRLNCSGDISGEQCAVLADNITRSLHAMGWRDACSPQSGDEPEPESDPESGTEAKLMDGVANAIGRLSPDLHAALELSFWRGHLLETADLAGRNNANLALASCSGLNFRHGGWRANSGMNLLKSWYRSFAIVALLVVVWAVGMMWQNYHLDAQIRAEQQRVIQAFHTGLPDEKVMIDALAQLRKAAGSSGAAGGKGSSRAMLWLQQINAMNRVYQRMPWQIKSLSMDHGRMSMSGSVKDLQSMNKIRQALQQETGATVKVQDTNLGDKLVQFRMAW